MDGCARRGAEPLRVLEGADLDLAVARGAAYYGYVRRGHGIRIRGGTAMAYYVGVESAMPAVPGFRRQLTALCVAPFGMEEGTRADMPAAEFGLVVGEPVRFHFFGSSVRRDDRAGAACSSLGRRRAQRAAGHRGHTCRPSSSGRAKWSRADCKRA